MWKIILAVWLIYALIYNSTLILKTPRLKKATPPTAVERIEREYWVIVRPSPNEWSGLSKYRHGFKVGNYM